MIKLEIVDKKMEFEYDGNGQELMAELACGIDAATKKLPMILKY